jgi:hypothetical protein
MSKAQMKYLVCLTFGTPREVLPSADMVELTANGYIKNGDITDKGRTLVALIGKQT